MRLSTVLLIISWIPLIQLQVFRFEYLKQGIDVVFIALFFLLYAVTALVVKKKYHINIGVYNSNLRLLLMVGILAALFGVPAIWAIYRVLEFEQLIGQHIPPAIGIFFLAISVALCGIALVLAWKEMREKDKPYVPVLKFVLASTFLLWQFNLGIRFYYDLPLSLEKSISENTEYLEFLEHLVTVKTILFIGYFILNILFFCKIFSMKKFKERQPLFFTSTGLSMILGTYLFTFLQVTVARFLVTYTHSITIALTFVTVIGAVLVIAVVLTSFGGILSFFKTDSAHKPVPVPMRRKALVISLITIGLYLALFGSIWPVKDPSIAVLIREIKKSEDFFKHTEFFYNNIGIDSCKEILYFGRTAVIPLLNYLNDEDEFVKKFSISLLGLVGDKRAVEPLVEELKNKKFIGEAVHALAHIKDKRATLSLIKVLNENKLDPWEIECLGELGDPRMIDPLLEKLSDEEYNCRVDVLDALCYFKEARVIDALIEKLGEKESVGIRTKISETLSRITGETCSVKEEKIPEWWRNWWEKNREKMKERFKSGKNLT